MKRPATAAIAGMLLLMSFGQATASGPLGTIEVKGPFNCEIVLDVFPQPEKTINSSQCSGTVTSEGEYRTQDNQVDKILASTADFRLYNVQYRTGPPGIELLEANGHFTAGLVISSVDGRKGAPTALFTGQVHGTFDLMAGEMTSPSSKLNVPAHIHVPPASSKHKTKDEAKVSCRVDDRTRAPVAVEPLFVPPNPVTGDDPVEDGQVAISGTLLVRCVHLF